MSAYTKQTQQVKDLWEEFKGPLWATARALSGWRKTEVPPGTWRELKKAATKLYPVLTMTFEEPSQADRLKKYMRRIKNLQKMLAPYRTLTSTEDLVALYEEQSSRSKDAAEKIGEYMQDVIGILVTFDSEPLGGFRVGGMKVELIQQGGAAWTPEMVEKLKAVLAKSAAYLQKRGLGDLTKGLLVFAYPTAGIPGVMAANAWYNRKKDVAAIAAGSAWFKKSSPERMVQTMVHELGHRAYYRLMGNTGRRAWEQYFEDMQTDPGVDTMIREWEAFVNDADSEREARQRSHSQIWLRELQSRDAEKAEWLMMALDSLNLRGGEKYDSYRGLPTKSSKAALDEMKARKGEVKVFSEPVTAYSATNPSELFAEAFAHYLSYGPRTLSPRVRDQFQRTMPKMKMARLTPLQEAFDARKLAYLQLQLERWGAYLIRDGLKAHGSNAVALGRALGELTEAPDQLPVLKRISQLYAELQKMGRIRTSLNVVDRQLEDVYEKVLRPHKARLAALRVVDRYTE